MNNLRIYEQVRRVPDGAQKTIRGGRLKGMTDINPMWRIKTLTEQFGPCGFGWYYEITERWTETTNGGETTANVRINLYIKDGDNWSAPIEGIGGSMLVSNERSGLYVNDECFKMALTDAISVACKALGFGADVYWQADATKYSDEKKNNFNESQAITGTQKRTLTQYAESCGSKMEDIFKYCQISNIDEMTAGMYGKVLAMLKAKREKQ